jgi:hypothetical protein
MLSSLKAFLRALLIMVPETKSTWNEDGPGHLRWYPGHRYGDNTISDRPLWENGNEQADLGFPVSEEPVYCCMRNNKRFF